MIGFTAWLAGLGGRGSTSGANASFEDLDLEGLEIGSETAYWSDFPMSGIWLGLGALGCVRGVRE